MAHVAKCSCGEVHVVEPVEGGEETRAELLARVIAAIPAKVELVDLYRPDGLDVRQVVELYDAKGWRYEVTSLDIFESDTRWEGEAWALDNLRDECNVSACAWDDIEEDVLEVLRDRDVSDPIGQVIDATREMWHRYTFGPADLADFDDTGVGVYASADDVFRVLGVDVDTVTPAQRAAVEGVISNAYACDVVAIVWSGDVADIAGTLRAVENGEQVTYTWENPYVCVWSPWTGAGHANMVEGLTVSTVLNPDRLRLDEPNTGQGYTFTGDVCGGWCNDRSTFTTTTTTPARATVADPSVPFDYIVHDANTGRDVDMRALSVVELMQWRNAAADAGDVSLVAILDSLFNE